MGTHRRIGTFALVLGTAVAATGVTIASASAAATPTVTWSRANSVATGDQDDSSIASNRTGYTAVTWEDDRDPDNPDEDSDSEIFLRLYKNGASQYETKLSTTGADGTDWKHRNPDVALDDKGDAVVVWADDADGNEAFNISYRVVSPTGAVTGSGRANASTAGNHILPRVAVDPDGPAANPSAVAFTVAWEDVQGSAHTIRAAGYSSATTKAYEVTASPTTGTHFHPDVAVTGAGDAIVVWDQNSSSTVDVGLVKLAQANGAVLLSRRLANATTAGDQHDAAVAANASGAFAVAWESTSVFERSFAADGTPRHADVAVSSGSGATAASIGLDDAANVVVGWTVTGTNPDVWVRGFNPDGTGTNRIAAQKLSQSTTGRQEQIAVAVAPQGALALSYTDDADGDSFDDVLIGLPPTSPASPSASVSPPVSPSASVSPPPPASIKPVSWWENKYIADEDYFNENYGNDSSQSDSWPYYDLAYGVDDVVAMYLATGKTHYLDQALLWTNNVVARAKPSSTLGGNAFGDSYLGWISNQNGSQNEEVPLYESYLWRYVTRMLLVIKQTPALYNNSTYRTQYDKLLAFTEANIWDKWYTRGVNDYIYRDYTHLASHWAFIAMDLTQMTTNATRLAQEQTVFDNMNYHLPMYNNTSLHGQMITSPVNSGAYFWDWAWGSFARPGSDVSHGNAVLAYIVEAHDLGLGGWTDADIQKFVVTFNKVVWPVDGGPYPAYVDGSGTDNGWFIDGWMKLGRYDAHLQQRLETHDVGISDGNGALNAKRLGATG
jgi:hypothetical protein